MGEKDANQDMYGGSVYTEPAIEAAIFLKKSLL